MGGSKPKPVQLPNQQQTQQQNTYGYMSPSGSPEAQSFLSAPLNFGGSYANLNTGFQIDPAAGNRAAGREQDVNRRYDSAFTGGVPAWIREINRNKEIREVQGQGAAETQQAEYLQQQGQRGLEFQKAQLQEDASRAQQLAEAERRRQLLPQLVQTGGSSTGSGYNTQIQPGQQGIFGSLLQGAGSAIGGLAAGGFI